MVNFFKITILLLTILFFSFNYSFAQKEYNNEYQKYSQVRIFATTPADFQRIQNAGLYLDGGVHKPGLYFETWLSQTEIGYLRNSGVPFTITIDDWDKYYQSQPKMTPQDIQNTLHQVYIKDNITHSIYGTMGGFLKYSEVAAKLDSMRLQYPTFISAKFSLGTTYESRTQWCVRITKNPDAPTGRPEVYYHGIIHAREPESMEAQMYYFYWLFENYNIDPWATFILNNREIYWIPVYNPDGYVYNETTNPTGGGQWRTNRHNNGSNCGYTDLNRNFGLYQYWNSSNGGSSTDPCNGGQGTYRGTAPNSEIENQNVENFFISRNFKTGIGGHTYGNYIIKPWCWSDPSPTPDDALYNRFLADMRQYNGYTVGFPSQTVGYYVRGGSDDWMYNDSGHAAGTHAFVVTCETGTTGFWPTQAEIIPLAQGMLWPCQYISLVAGPWINIVRTGFSQAYYDPNSTGNFKVVFSNKGISAATNVKIQCIPQNTNISIPVQSYTFASEPANSTDSATFSFQVSATPPNGCGLPLLVTVKQNDTLVVFSKTIYCYIGPGNLPLADSAENGFTRWTAGGTGGTWQVVTNNYHSASHSFADNGSNVYANNANNYMVLTTPLNLATTPICNLTYWQVYSTENGYDFCYLETSSDNGATWQTVSQWTGANTTWTKQSFDLTSYANGSTQFKIRFRLQSDGNVTGQGWHVDDIRFSTYCQGVINSIGNNEQLPVKYSLDQNYPNPFNPVTRINYAIAKEGFVRLTVYDLLGREVNVLVNEVKNAGFYSVDFNGSNLSSGVYFYKLESNGFVDTKKMTLIK